jgi:glycosyltransferase involved in cell wall biosynthesis
LPTSPRAARVLILTDWYPAQPGDPAGSFVRAQALVAARSRQVAVAHLAGGRPPLDETCDGSVRTLRARRTAPWPVTAGNLTCALAADRRLRRSGFAAGLVHAHGFGPGLAALAVARPRGLPVVISEHSSLFAAGGVRGAAELIARVAFAGADIVCPVSESQRAVLEQAGHRGPFRVVPNPVDTGVFSPAPSPSPNGPLRIAVVASLVPVKGVEDLIQALSLIKDLNVSVDIAGDGPLREALESRSAALGLRGVVTFHGTLTSERVARLMRAAAFAVVPSRWETYSVAAAEAMACGLPVVATRVGGLPERVHAGNGILVPPRDPAALAEGVRRMLATHASFDRAAIVAEVQRVCSHKAVAARWDAVYGEALALRGGR